MTNKYGMGSLGLGSLSNMLESVDLVKKAWSSFNLPSSLAPTMDIDELDKRIADLKTVEQWLNVNLSMLHGTIQGMEIQRGTLAAIKAFGQAVAPNGEGLAGMAAAAAAAATRAAQSGAAAAQSNAAAARAAKENAASPRDPEPAAQSGQPAEPAAAPAADSSMAADLSRAAAAAVNPATWWNLLQTQFNQVAQAAMSGSGLGSPAQAPREAATRAPRAGKSAARAKSGTAGAQPAAKTAPRAARKKAI